MKRIALKTSIIAGAIMLALPLSAVAADTTTVDRAKQNLENAQERVDKAEQNLQDARQNVRDVRDVQDKSTMKQINRQEDRQTMGEYVDDAGVTAKVKAKFVGQKGLDSLDIKVVTVDGKVTLMGDVDNVAQIGLAESAAKEVQGVNTVDNQLHVKK